MIVRLAVSGVGAFLVAAGLTPVAARVARRAGLIDAPKLERAHERPTPYLGGAAILTGIVGSLVIARGFEGAQWYRGQLVVIVLCAVGLGGIGLLDDWRPKLPRWRLMVELFAAVAVVAVDIQLRVTPWWWVNAALTIAWVVGITNAVNLLDNMDGLASGVVAIAAAGTAVLAVVDGQELVSALAIAITGASVGFLLHNRPPARVFMGDAGALSLGFLLAVTVAKLELLQAPGPKRLAVVVLLCGVGVFDTTLVVVTRLRRHVSPFRGGTDHTSHRLVRLGLSRGKAVAALHGLGGWFVGTAFAVHLGGTVLVGVVLVCNAALVGTLAWALGRLPHEGPLAPVRRHPAPALQA